MVCVQGKAKVEGITERVSAMKEQKEKIDLLIKQNAEAQLTRVDWARLNEAIARRIDTAAKNRSTAKPYLRIFRIAAGFTAAAAAVVVIALIFRPSEFELQQGRTAVVKLIESKGSASVEFKHTAAKPSAFVAIGGSNTEVAKCDVKITDLNGSWKPETDGPSWIIVSRPEPVVADNGMSKDMLAMIYLF